MSGHFSERFKMDDRGLFFWFRRKHVKQSPGSVTVNHSLYTGDCLERFGLADCKQKGTPAVMSSLFSKKGCPEAASSEAVSMKADDYRGLVGLILYNIIVRSK